MKLNITIDLEDLVESMQVDALSNAETDSEGYVSGDTFNLKEEIQQELVRNAVAKINNDSLHRTVAKLSLAKATLARKFDIMAKQNIEVTIANKMEDWFDKELVVLEGYNFGMPTGSTLNVGDLVEKSVNNGIKRMLDPRGSASIQGLIDQRVERIVGQQLAKFDASITKQVSMTAEAIIAKQVQATLTHTFTMMMKAGKNEHLLGEEP